VSLWNRYRDSRRPFATLFGFCVLVILGLAARLFQMQVIRGDFYLAMATRNHIRVVMRPAPRGIIRDRNGEVLADNVPAFMVSVVPSEFDTSGIVELAGYTGLRADSVRAMLATAASRPYRPFPLRRGLSVEQVSPLAENLYRLGGVVLEVVPSRRYPAGDEFCHLVGYVGLASAEDSYEGEVTGRSGLELTVDAVLAGEPGFRREVVDAHGRIVEEFQGGGEVDPVPGSDITLTIDAGLQRDAVRVLAIERTPGAAVVLDYETGEILCLASSPVFDAGAVSRGMSARAWDSLCTDPSRPFLSRAWGARYPPGSVFKLVTAAYLVQECGVDPGFMPDPCYGSYHLGGRDFGCWTVHGRLDLIDALAQSCDVFFYRTVQYGSLDGLAAYARGFGLGSRVTDVLPGEVPGLVPDSRMLDSLYGPGGWGLGNLLNVSIGQGELLVTPLQMACVAGIFASGGSMPGVSLVSGRDPSEPVSRGFEISPEAVEAVVEGMRAAVADPSGTLRVLDQLPWDFYGKSGTAESGTVAHAWVVGFIREPRPLAIAVVVEHGGHGGAVAAPIVARILSSYLRGIS
jgi:penicillin-binding protein 2